MKKYFVFIVVFFLIGGMSAQAQVKLGLKAGVNFSSVDLTGDVSDILKKNFDRENLGGFQVGPMLEGMFGLIGFDLAVLYSQESVNLPKDLSGVIKEFDSYKKGNLKVPLNLKAKITLLPKLLSVYGTAGPYLDFKLSDKLADTWNTQSFGAGLNFGFGAQVLGHLQVGVNYQLGLTDDYSSVKLNHVPDFLDIKAKTRMWSVTAAYLF